MTEMLPHTALTAICGWRDAALAKMREAAVTIERGHALAEEAKGLAANATSGAVFHLDNRSEDDAFRRLFMSFNRAESEDVYRKHLDACVWMSLLTLTGMNSLMDRTARDEFYKLLSGDVPEVSEEAVRGVFESLAGDAQMIFARGLARAFIKLDRRFRSHLGFKIGSRIVLTNVFDADGHWYYSTRMDETISDIERVFAVLDNNPGEIGSLVAQMRIDRGQSWQARQSITTTTYFMAKVYKNGNVHLWFERPDLVTLANIVLAAYYGEVLADAMPRDPEPDIRSKSGLPSTKLSFYATPPEVAAIALREVHITRESRVLEPSAGEGGIARALLATGAQVHAVEIDFDRCSVLRGIGHPRLRVMQANFLRMTPTPLYTHVVMNPPFSGTHWMEHVTHAFDFLEPGGVLVSVLPVTAELGDSPKHEAFRAWAAKQCRYGELRFEDLPPESFAASGTRINTVILRIYK